MNDLTMMTTPGKATLNNAGAVPFTRLIRLEQIKLKDEFRGLFPVVQDNLILIAQRMTENGYDNSQPLHVWECEEGLVLVDGHHRRAAAIRVGITEVPCYLHHFRDHDEALEYAISLQTERRNLSDAELLDMLPKVDALKKRGMGTNGEKGRSSERTAELLHTSRSRVETMRTIEEYGDEEMKEKLRNGEASLHETYLAALEKKGTGKKTAVKRKKNPATAFMEKAAGILGDAGETKAAELLIEAFIPEEEREDFRVAVSGRQRG
jgi:ParB family chromosome partitioning protein